MEAKKAAALAELHEGLHSVLSERRCRLERVHREGELETIAELVRLRGETDEPVSKRRVGKLLQGAQARGCWQHA